MALHMDLSVGKHTVSRLLKILHGRVMFMQQLPATQHSVPTE